jgi:dinuclear metal center YbgI/SA1388 family protein
MIRVSDIVQWMEEWAPPSFAMEWDRIGLQVGNPDERIETVLATLDINEQVVQEAIHKGAKMIVAHHPLIFQPLKELRLDTEKGKVLQLLLQHNIAVYAAHTNLDIADGGVNDCLAERLQLRETQILSRQGNEELLKFVVFVPKSHVDEVRAAICQAGAGWIGRYSHCTFSTDGHGTFMPMEGTNPFIGKQGILETVQEVRLETIVPRRIQAKVVEACRKAHPYEEVAYDLYPLEVKGKAYGIGRIGMLEHPMTLSEFAAWTKERLASKHVRFVGEPTRQITRVAVLGGSGIDWAKDAKTMGADVLVTGDVKYHEAQDAHALGIAVVDAGHYATETWIKYAISNVLTKRSQEVGMPLRCIPSEVDTEMFQSI